MGIPQADWKNQPAHILDWVIVGVSMGLLAIYLYLWWVEQLTQYLGIVVILVAGGLVYFTDYWQPVLYLVMSVFLIIHLFISIVTGSWRHSLIQVASSLKIIIIILGTYLFYREDIYGTKKDQT